MIRVRCRIDSSLLLRRRSPARVYEMKSEKKYMNVFEALGVTCERICCEQREI